ncbi:HvfB family MNIO-type RiPP peptide maturase [Neisseria canis]|uniref:Protein of uncharacterized function (DUF692) n=1 Tax=Neisseria canis TaxID=493 RepID=A0A1X3D0D7_9NEIS|nr:DUF692 domain-containing protein [Neisseria canis]OSI13380.1 hypothetical protein BWD07_00260 [Neisseria canis]VEE99368.1 Protein of uncharacterised function (DUF692) [Neisseria canis]
MATVLQGAGLGFKRDLAEDLLNTTSDSPIQFIEVAPENWIKTGGAARKQLDALSERFPIACHGLSLSLGGRDPLQVGFLQEVKAFMRQYKIDFFSEHLSYCSHFGHLYDLLPLTFNDETVRHTAARIRQTQDILEMRIAIENTSSYLLAPGNEMSEVAFLNAVAKEADCDIHLDINNIYVNAMNHGQTDGKTFIDTVDLGRVVYLHMAGHDSDEEILIDTHGEAICGDVWSLFDYACSKFAHQPPCLLERDTNFPPFAELEAEVARIAAIQKIYGKQADAA